jgi:hypothetical protein
MCPLVGCLFLSKFDIIAPLFEMAFITLMERREKQK